MGLEIPPNGEIPDIPGALKWGQKRTRVCKVSDFFRNFADCLDNPALAPLAKEPRVVQEQVAPIVKQVREFAFYVLGIDPLSLTAERKRPDE